MSSPRDIVVSAPGKVMISGEYVVLEGAPAIVAAAGARALARLSPRARDGSPDAAARSLDAPSLPPEAVLSREHAERAFGALPDMSLSIDTSALKSDGRKLGLGSSAATAAAVVSAIAAAHGRDPSEPSVRDAALPIALAGHAAVAPEGSGADVAASTLGGFVRFQRDGERTHASRIEWPALEVALVWTGTPARTSDLVRTVKALAARDASAYRRAIAPLHEAAAALLQAIEQGDTSAAIDAASAHHAAMRALGEASGAPIVTPELERAADVARSLGGAAKPSGAGGGDVAVAFLPGNALRADLDQACREAGLTLLSLGLGDDGPRVER